MSFSGKTVVVVGASGVVGSGVVRKYLDAGATVFAVSRSAESVERLRSTIGAQPGDRLRGVVGDFADDESAARAKEAIFSALAGAAIDHAVSVQGFVNFAKPPTQSPMTELKGALDSGLYNNLYAAQSLLAALKSRDGSSFTLVSGGLAHIPPPNPALWLGTVKNAALNALTLALAAETAGDKVRVNCVSIHFGVAPIGGDKNQFGMAAEGDTLRLAPAFLGVARGSQKGQVLCLHSWADAEKLAG